MEEFLWNAGFFLMPISAIGFVAGVASLAKKSNKSKKKSVIAIIICIVVFCSNIVIQNKIQENRILESFYDGEGIPISEIVDSINSNKTA